MSADRFTKVLLTVIALELGWIAVNDVSLRVSAQQAEPMAVVIRGIQLDAPADGSLPVTLVRSTSAVRVAADRPIPIEAPRPIVIETGERPLLVQNVRARPAARPGE